jgi:hypothetical protein
MELHDDLVRCVLIPEQAFEQTSTPHDQGQEIKGNEDMHSEAGLGSLHSPANRHMD